ncbi:TAXI family TRAP transporter solute-binding subunit [Kutzneria sp. CA-103260]|uniref:TAXI family TRAP transporter solute-binding subunit n=1 Tax=Kutzneria sp. CA-103260 TaxID=2802641 RepID=UPI001BED3EEA|nr:TAXI family TRAP transporter solute-binding subunit [Kutzneria sp. CA-103260]QUQ71782.1 immunogenic protein [Kutzneria sp. CA-103260]
MLDRRALLRGLAAVGVGSVVAGCSGPQAPDLARLVLLTGPPGAVFREIGASLVAALKPHLPRTVLTAQETGSSVDNLRLLADGTGQLGFASLDAIEKTRTSPAGLSAVGRLYDSFMHLVVLKESPIQSFKDIDGKRVSLGAPGSSTGFTADRLLAMTGVRPVGSQLSQTDAANALAAGTLDALLTLTGIPTPAITDLARKRPIRLVDLTAEAKALAAAFPGPYVPATIPTTTYKNVEPCQTVSVPNLLLTRDDLGDDVVRIVTETTFTEVAAFTKGHPEASHINVRTGIATGIVPLHPGAAGWFRDVKR